MKNSLSDLRCKIMFSELFSLGTNAVLNTVNGCLKLGSEKEFDLEVKKLFFETAKMVFEGKSKIDPNIIKDLKNLFETNETLLELQKDFDIKIIGSDYD